MSDGSVDSGTTTTTEVPVETPSPANDPAPAETPVTPEPSSVTDKSSERFSATPPPSPTLSPALQPGPSPASPSQPQETPVIHTPTEVPPAQATHAPASSVSLSIKDRAYAALEKIRFNKRRKLDKILQLARTKGWIKNDDVEKLLKVSDATATNYLNQLVREGRLKRVGNSHQPAYELP